MSPGSEIRNTRNSKYKEIRNQAWKSGTEHQENVRWKVSDKAECIGQELAELK
jgi:hypothetical protein